MPTLRQKVDAFCKESGAKVDTSDKLRSQVLELKVELKSLRVAHKNHMKQMKAASKTVKAPKVVKAPAVPKVVKAPKVKQEVAMQPLPAAMPQTATAGRRTRRHRRY